MRCETHKIQRDRSDGTLGPLCWIRDAVGKQRPRLLVLSAVDMVALQKAMYGHHDFFGLGAEERSRLHIVLCRFLQEFNTTSSFGLAPDHLLFIFD